MPRRLTLLLLLLFATLQAASKGAPANTPLLSVIRVLQAQGYELIYSSSLVTPELQIAVESHSLSALRKALPGIGLKLEKIDRVWVISRLQAPATRVTGYLISPDGKPIADGQITVPGSETQKRSGTDGYFEMTLDDGNETIIVGAEGFREQTITASSITTGRIVLQPESLLENVIVTGSLYRFPYRTANNSSFSLSSEEISSAPAIGGDAMRIVNRLPGIASVGVTAKPRIRGGAQDEVLILLDGIELLEPFHLADFQAGYSSIDHRTVDSVDIYTGGFPVRYGNRMSGVIDVRTERAESPFNTEIGLSNFSVFVNTRGKAGENGSVNWLLAARRGNLEELTQFLDSRATSPRYADASARVSIALSDQRELTFGGLLAEDDISITDQEENASSKVENGYLWSRLDTEHHNQLYSTLIFSFARTDREKRENSPLEEDGKGGFFNFSQKVRQFTLRNDYSYSLNEHLFEFGLQAAWGSADYDYSGEFNRSILATLLGNEQRVDEEISTQPRGWAGGAYLQTELAFSKLTLQPSVRWDFQRYYFTGKEQQVSPRLGIAYDFNSNSRLWLSLGRFYQPEGIHELQVIDRIQKFFKPQRSDHALLGLNWQRGDFQLKGELYYKRYHNPKPRFENLFNPFVLLPELEPDRVFLEPEKALARGLDIELKYAFTPALMGLMRYSHMRAEDRILDRWIPRRWSQRNTWHAQLSWQTDHITLSAALSWHSGWRTSKLPASVQAGSTIPAHSVLNNFELKNYLSLDIGASKSWQVGKTLVTLHTDISNLTERDNPAGIDFDIDEGDGEVLFEADNETLLPLVFSAGIILSF